MVSLYQKNDYWFNGKYDVSPSELGKIDATTLSVSNSRKEDSNITFDIKNTGKNIAAFIKLNVLNSQTGEIILPGLCFGRIF